MIDEALIQRLRDDEIRDGLRAAIDKNILPVMLEKAYPGHFAITAEHESFGRDCTWPGLDSWQLTGAYLLLGQTRLVLDYFDFVEASQRADGNIPFAVFPEEDVRAPEKRATHLRGMRYPEDIFTYAPGRGYIRNAGGSGFFATGSVRIRSVSSETCAISLRHRRSSTVQKI